MTPSILFAKIAPPAIGSGRGTRVANGVHWLRMPLDGPLAAVNVYLLEDRDGWTIVDTGARSDASITAWRRAMVHVLSSRPVRKIVVTHMHPDHAGMAGWLCRKFDATLCMTGLEQKGLRNILDASWSPRTHGAQFYHAAGMDWEWITEYCAVSDGFRDRFHALPPEISTIADGDRIEIDHCRWEVITGGGHSPEHASLWCPQRCLLLSGDQALPTISSNVSLNPEAPDADPLGDWLDSLNRLRKTVPDDALVMPGHGTPFRGLHSRLDDLVAGHQAALSRLSASLSTPSRAIDTFETLFSRKISDHLTRRLAVGEALAHLTYLAKRGLATVAIDPDGVAYWSNTTVLR